MEPRLEMDVVVEQAKALGPGPLFDALPDVGPNVKIAICREFITQIALSWWICFDENNLKQFGVFFSSGDARRRTAIREKPCRRGRDGYIV